MIQKSIKKFNAMAYHEEWLKRLSPSERAEFLANREKENFEESLAKALEYEFNKLKHYFYAVATTRFGGSAIQIYIRHTDEKTTARIEFVNNFTELMVSNGLTSYNIFLGDPEEFDPKKILDNLYDNLGPKGGLRLANLLEDALKKRDIK